MNLRMTALVAALLSPAAHAQLFQTVQATARQPVLKGFAVQGNTLQKGSTRLTLDTAGGYVYGVQIEAATANDLARAMTATWGTEEGNIPKLAASLSRPGVMAEARAGIQEFSDDYKGDFFAIKLTGSGKTQLWKAYIAVQIWPDSAFPATGNALGAANAPATLRLFSDFQCPYCQQLAEETLPDWKKNSAQYRVLHYHFPLPFHKNAFPAAEAAECAAQQGKFWPYTDQLFAGLASWQRLTGTATTAKFEEYGKGVGLNMGSFRQCVSSHATKNTVQAQMDAGVRVGVGGTPTVFLNGVHLYDYTDPTERRVVMAITAPAARAQATIQARLGALR